MEKTIGEICEKTFHFEWKVAVFLSLSDENGSNYQSPTFECCDALWKFILYANGSGEEEIGWVSLFLNMLQPRDSQRTVKFKVSMKYDDKIIRVSEGSNSFSNKQCWGWPKLIKRDEVLEKLRTSAQNVLYITSSITWSSGGNRASEVNDLPENVSIPSKPKASLETLVHNLKELYINQSNCDFTINVKDKVFTAHKLILGIRSSVFASTFAHDMAENLSGTMKMDDFEPDIVKEFLMYIYTGDVENLSWRNIFDLYVISDKYDVQDLKKECLEFMKSKLCLETVCTVLLLAEKYTETELLKLAKDFVGKCASKLLTSDHWKRLESENVLLADKVLKMIVLDNAWRIK